MIQLLNQLSQRPVYRSAQVDFLFTGWFCIEAIVMLYVLIKRLTLDGPAGYGDLVAFMVILYGFMLPGALYLLYAVVVFGMSWAQKSDPTAALHTLVGGSQ
jgi:hypothetical protein